MSIAVVIAVACMAQPVAPPWHAGAQKNTQSKDGAPTAHLVERPAASVPSVGHDATDHEQEDIAWLVAELVQIDKPDFGLSATLAGSRFAPIESSHTVRAIVLRVDHDISPSEPVRRLVDLGPKALPALLRALDDATPTKLSTTHEDGFGAMWYAHEVPINPLHPRELAAQAQHEVLVDGQLDPRISRPAISKHAITRGDVAFVILGQIVNRDYVATRYQPTACIVINSPSHDESIAAAVRAIWSSDDPAKMLFDSLLIDFCSRGQFPDFQSGAAMRLAYYFPEESRALLVHRLDELDVHVAPWQSPGFEDAWRKQDEANGVAMCDFIRAIAWSNDAAIVEAVARIIERTNEPAVLEACLSPAVAKAKPDLVRERLSQTFARPRELETPGPFGTEYKLLCAALRLTPDNARPLFERWVAHDTLNSRRAVIHAIEEAPGQVAWAVGLLAPLLDDTTDTGWQYGPDAHRKPIRVCDEAAHAISAHLRGATFEFNGNQSDLDRQIAAIRLRVAEQSEKH